MADVGLVTGKQRRLVKRTALRVLLYAALVTGGVVFSLPFLWLVTVSFKGPDEIFAQPMQWIPRVWRERPIELAELFRNYITATEFIPFWLWIRNTLHVTVLSVTFTLLSCSMVAYGFSRITWRARDVVFVLVLATMMLPAQVTMIPIFLIYNKLGWYNTYWALIVPSLFSVTSTFLMRQYFRGIPLDLDEAARMDGASSLLIWWRVIMPLSGPVLAALAIFTFQGAWNDFLWPLVVTASPEMRTIPIGLASFQGQYSTAWNLLMAGSVIALLPVLVLYILGQNWFVRGITLSGMGGR